MRIAVSRLAAAVITVVSRQALASMSAPSSVDSTSTAVPRGSLAGGYLEPERLRDQIDAVRSQTTSPFAVNLFAACTAPVDPAVVETASASIAPLRGELGLPPHPTITSYAPSLDDHLVSRR